MILDELKIIATVSLDFYINSIKTINVKQYDTGSRFILVSFTEYGKKIGISPEFSVIVRYKKADGKYGLRDCTILEDGNVLIETTEQMLAVSGKCRLDLAIFNSKMNAESYSDVTSFEEIDCSVLSTMPLDLNVVATPINNAELESNYDFSAITKALAETKEAEKDLIDKNARWEQAELERQKSEKNRESTFNEVIANVEQAIENANNISEYTKSVGDEVSPLIEPAKQATLEANEASDNANEAANAANDAAALCQSVIDQSGIVKKSGDTMTGDLVVPTLYAEKIVIGDGIMSYNKDLSAFIISFSE